MRSHRPDVRLVARNRSRQRPDSERDSSCPHPALGPVLETWSGGAELLSSGSWKPRSFDKSRWLGVRFGGCTEGSLDRGPESRREEWGCGKRIRTRWVRILDIIPACAKNRSRLQPNRRYCLKSIPSPPPKCSQP